MGLHKKEDIKSKEIIETIIKDDKNNLTNNEQILSQKSEENETKENLETFNKEIKKEILKISEEKMNERIKGLNINDEEKLSKELIDYNNKSNEYLILAKQKDFPLLIQTESEITALSKDLSEKYIKNKQKQNESL